MRTTIRIDDDLHARAKRAAADTKRTLSAVVEDALREALARRDAFSKRRRKVRLPTWGEGGLRPGVGLDNSSALLDVLDDKD